MQHIGLPSSRTAFAGTRPQAHPALPASVAHTAVAAARWPGVHVRATPRRRSQGSVADGLISVLKDELKVEKERYRTPEEVMAGPPNGFELEDTPHSNNITLARSFNGGRAGGRGRAHFATSMLYSSPHVRAHVHACTRAGVGMLCSVCAYMCMCVRGCSSF